MKRLKIELAQLAAAHICAPEALSWEGFHHVDGVILSRNVEQVMTYDLME